MSLVAYKTVAYKNNSSVPCQGSVMTLEFWNLCNFLYSFENYLILIVSIVYSYIMLLHILISENFKLWAFWSLNTISWSSKCFLATGQFAYFGWVWYSYCCQNLAVFTEPCHTPAAGSCKTLVLLLLRRSMIVTFPTPPPVCVYLNWLTLDGALSAERNSPRSLKWLSQ